MGYSLADNNKATQASDFLPIEVLKFMLIRHYAAILSTHYHLFSTKDYVEQSRAD